MFFTQAVVAVAVVGGWGVGGNGCSVGVKIPGSLVETRPPESLVLPSQHPGRDSSDSRRAAPSTNKCLFSTH